MLLGSSICLDFYGYQIKGQISKGNQAEVLALSNWVVYVARMFNMLFALTLAAVFETGIELRVSVVVFYAFSVAFILCFSYRRLPSFDNVIRVVLWPMIYLLFPRIKGVGFWRKPCLGVSNASVAMFVSTGFIYAAVILPFLVAHFVPQYRMTVVFIGQLMNFFATAILLGLVEPRIMRQLDNANEHTQTEIDKALSGRYAFIAMMVALSFVWMTAFTE